MYELGFFSKGLLIGLSIAAPVGAIGILCIRRSLAKGQLSGLATGLGAATADGFYGAVAAYGMTVILNFLTNIEAPLQLFGGAFLIYLSWDTYFAKVSTVQKVEKDAKSLFGDYFSTLGLTLANPSTIFSFLAIFAGLGIKASNGDPSSATALTIGVFLGSTIWWIFLSGAVSLLRKRVDAQALGVINKISALVLFVFGLLALVAFAKDILTS